MRELRARKAQCGIGLLGLLFWLILATAVITVGLRLGPSYMEYLTIRSVMADVSKAPDAAGAPPRLVLSLIGNRLDINSVASVTRKDFRFERAKDGGLNVSVKYEVRRPVAFNIDALLTFEHAESIPPE